MKRVVIVGGGASGLMAAIAAARQGSKVTVLEHQSQLGKKILVTGNGRCNYTNLDQDLSHYHGGNPEVIARVLSKFSVQETIDFFESLGIFPKNRNGYLYPHSDAAAAVLEVLRMECEHLQVKLACQIQIEKIEKSQGVFLIHTPGWIYECDRLILACGSKAAPGTGSDGSGYELAVSLGHQIVPVVPALTQLLSRSKYLKPLAGIRIEAKVSLYEQETLLGENQGELQLNGGNISGIPVFQISGLAARKLLEGAECEVAIDFLPQMTETQFMEYLKKRSLGNEFKNIVQFFLGLFPKKLAEVLQAACGFSGKKKIKDLTEGDFEKLVQTIKKFPIPIYGTNGFENAQCCSGGVCLDEIDPETMESKCCKDLYLCGELLDVHGDCGGYNLQWAWTSGYLAGVSGND